MCGDNLEGGLIGEQLGRDCLLVVVEGLRDDGEIILEAAAVERWGWWCVRLAYR